MDSRSSPRNYDPVLSFMAYNCFISAGKTLCTEVRRKKKKLFDCPFRPPKKKVGRCKKVFFFFWAKSDLYFSMKVSPTYYKQIPTLVKMESLAKYAMSFEVEIIKFDTLVWISCYLMSYFVMLLIYTLVFPYATVRRAVAILEVWNPPLSVRRHKSRGVENPKQVKNNIHIHILWH